MKRVLLIVATVLALGAPSVAVASGDDCRASERCCEPTVGNPCTIGG